jgi:hypothetical protein
MSLNAYWAYGLRIHSELACPELPSLPLEAGNPDVTIHLLPAAEDALESLENGYYEVQPGIFRLAVRGVAQYRVEEGSRIFIEPLPDVPLEKIRLFLLGSAMGALLYQRGLFPLHGSAVETPWGAMIFVGAQGAGKSTLAAQFHRKGYRLLSDDVCAVAPTPEGLQVLPALAHFRLCADAFERLGAPRAGALRWTNSWCPWEMVTALTRCRSGRFMSLRLRDSSSSRFRLHSRCFQALTGCSASWRIFIGPIT